MLQLLANRTSQGETVKAGVALQSSTLTDNVTLPDLSGPIPSLSCPLAFFFLQTAASTPRSHVEMKFLGQDGHATRLPLSLPCSVHDNLVIRHYRVDSRVSLYFSVPTSARVKRARAMKFERNRTAASKLRF